MRSKEFITEIISEKWSKKYKSSINCSNPKGFSQKAHCAGRKKKTNENNAPLDVNTLSISNLAKKWNVPVQTVLTQVRKGVKIEHEHTNNLFVALEIALDHLKEKLDYYDQLKKVETNISEAIGELPKSAEIYVDMDGVLADFFGDWAKLMNKKDWREINDVSSGLDKIRQSESFWLNLPLTNNAIPLLRLIKKIKGSYNILSSPLPDDPNSEPHKREWIKKNLSFFLPKNVIITHDKAKYAQQPDGTANILIDDFGSNIQKWNAAGGIGIKHKDYKFDRTADALASVNEASYEGNIGIMELMKFFQTAPIELVAQVKELISQKRDKEVWKIVQTYTGTKLKGKEFTENFADGKKPGRKGLAKRMGICSSTK